MSYSPYEDPREHRSRNINEGFRVGLIGGITVACLHLLLPIFSGGRAWGDLLAWLLQWVLYFLLARSAAQRQYNKNQMELSALQGVQGAGVGAALVTSVLNWIFLLVRAFIVNAMGSIVIVEPISLYCIIVIDVIIALGIGAWGGGSIAKKYEITNLY
jgi:hypothetical protein